MKHVEVIISFEPRSLILYQLSQDERQTDLNGEAFFCWRTNMSFSLLYFTDWELLFHNYSNKDPLYTANKSQVIFV